MELDRNYLGYPQMMNNMYQNYTCSNYENKMSNNMPPYMYGKCMNNCNEMYHMNHMADGVMNNCYRLDTYMNPYQMNKMEPLEKMCGKTYNVLIIHVHKTMNKIIMENMGMMPKSISKEKFNKELNEMICEVLKKEDEIKKLIMIDRDEEEQDIDRGFCPFCGGVLKDALAILLVTELVKGGCTTCY